MMKNTEFGDMTRSPSQDNPCLPPVETNKTESEEGSPKMYTPDG